MCSQSEFHEESQSLVVESQSDEPQVPVKLDFQAEFLRSMGLDSNDISQIASHKRSNTEHKLDSQTDVEVIMTAYMIDKSFQNQGNTPKVRLYRMLRQNLIHSTFFAYGQLLLQFSDTFFF